MSDSEAKPRRRISCVLLSECRKSQSLESAHYFSIRPEWIPRIRKGRREADWRPSSNDRLCSVHFTPDDLTEDDDIKEGHLPSLYLGFIPSAEIEPAESPVNRSNKAKKRSYVPSTTDDTEAIRAKSRTKTDGNRVHGFARGLEPEKIMGATDASGELCFLIKWVGSEEVDLVPAREANKKCPHVVISFYEQRLWYYSGRSSNDSEVIQ